MPNTWDGADLAHAICIWIPDLLPISKAGFSFIYDNSAVVPGEVILCLDDTVGDFPISGNNTFYVSLASLGVAPTGVNEVGCIQAGTLYPPSALPFDSKGKYGLAINGFLSTGANPATQGNATLSVPYANGTGLPTTVLTSPPIQKLPINQKVQVLACGTGKVDVGTGLIHVAVLRHVVGGGLDIVLAQADIMSSVSPDLADPLVFDFCFAFIDEPPVTPLGTGFEYLIQITNHAGQIVTLLPGFDFAKIAVKDISSGNAAWAFGKVGFSINIKKAAPDPVIPGIPLDVKRGLDNADYRIHVS